MTDTKQLPSEEYAANVTDEQLAASQAQAESGGSTWKDIAGKAWETMLFLGGKVKEAATWVWNKGKELVNKWMGKDVSEPGPNDPQEGQPEEPEEPEEPADGPQDGETPETPADGEEPGYKPGDNPPEEPWADPDDPSPGPDADERERRVWNQRNNKRMDQYRRENPEGFEEYQREYAKWREAQQTEQDGFIEPGTDAEQTDHKHKRGKGFKKGEQSADKFDSITQSVSEARGKMAESVLGSVEDAVQDMRQLGD